MALQIGELAKRSEVNKETIRYYERLGMIPEPKRTDAGYRKYSEEMIERLGFIKRMQALGFTLKEIDKFLGVVDNDKAKCKDMIDFSKEKLKEIQEKIDDLQRIEKMLKQLHSCCDSPNESGIYECEIIATVLKGQFNCKTR